MVKLLRPKIKLRVVFLFSCFLVFIFYLIFKSDYLTVKRVECRVKEKTSLADENRWCETVKREVLGQRILSLKRQAIASEIRQKFLPVGDVAITKKYPQTAIVQISERKPIAQVCPSGGLGLLVDKEGVIYAETQAEPQNLKTVSLELGFELTLGQEIGADIVSLILLEEPQISFIKSTGQEGLEVVSNAQLKIFFSRKRDLRQQIENLQKIIQKYKIEGKELSQVDLRYDQPVIKY